MNKKQTKPLSESQVQTKTIAAFEVLGWYVVKNIQTNKNGFPDLTLYKNSKTFFIECKKERKNECDPLQLYRHKELLQKGFLTIIVNDLITLNHAIESSKFL
jgi:hypothetical protein